MIKSSDWVIDLGPEGGDAGGWVIAEGTPEQVAATEASFTGQALATMLNQQNGHRSMGLNNGASQSKSVIRKSRKLV